MNVYIYQAELLCEDCGCAVRERLTGEGRAPADPDDEGTYDSDDFPKGPYPTGESDCPEHCGGCSDFLEYALTTDGRTYVVGKVAEAIEARRFDSVAIVTWAPFYGVSVPENDGKNHT